MSFSPDLKAKLVSLFEIPRSAHTIVHSGVLRDGSIGSEVQSDGYTIQDLQVISLERLQEILDSKDDNFYKLLETLVKNIDDFVEPVGQFYDDTMSVEVPVGIVDNKEIEVIVEGEFVPAPYEALLKKGEIRGTVGEDLSEGDLIQKNEKGVITKVKTGKNAKTTKAKSSKAK